MEITLKLDDRSLAVLESLTKALNSPNGAGLATATVKEPTAPEKPHVAAPVVDFEASRFKLADFCKEPAGKAKLKEVFASLGVSKLTEVKPQDLGVLVDLVGGVE